MATDFVLGDKLPWVCDMVNMILKRAPGGKPDGPKQTNIRKECVTNYAKAFWEMWVHAFGLEYVLSARSIKKKLISHLVIQHNYINGSKYKSYSKRARKIKWRDDNNSLIVILKPDVDPCSFDDVERKFFAAQKLPDRKGYIS